MHIYLIASESLRLMNEEVEKIIKKSTNVESFDMQTMQIQDLIENANYLSLFDEKRFIVAKNANFFGSEKISEQDQDYLLKYFERPNENTILIFTYFGKIDMRKKITKFIKENCKLIQIDKLSYSDLADKIKTLVKKDQYSIDNESINYIISQSLNNYDLIYNEIEKIKLYYSKPCQFKLNDIREIVSKTLEENQFKFIEAMVDKNLKKAFLLLKDLEILKIEPIVLISLLAREYRLMHMVKTLYEEKKSLNEISKKLKLQNWQTEKMLKNSFNYTFEELENNLIILTECDIELKTIYFDKYTIFKSYLLKTI